MKLFKRTLTTAVAVCLALQSAVVCFGADADEQIPSGGEEVGLYTSENDEAIQLTEDMYSSWYEGDQTYDGTEKTLYGYSLKDSNNYYWLTENEDYVVTYENNINVGTATATFTGIGNYTGSFTKNFNIVPTDIYRADIDCEYEQSYCAGKPVQPKPIVTYNDIVLAEGVDYEIEYEDDCGELGWHYAYIKGIGNFNGTDSFEYNVVEAEISSENISVDTSCTYTGYAQTPAPVVTVSGAVLRCGVDYNVSYTNNVNAGTGYMTIAGMNGYTGYVTVPFTISPKAVSEVEILKIADVDYTGKAVRPSLFVKADGNMIKSSDYTVTYYNNTNVGTATAVVTLGGNYESRYPVSTTFKIVLGKPKGFKATADSTTSVKLSWNKIGNCKYRVYRYDPKKKTYKRLTVTSSTSYTDKKLSEATSYTYAVKLEYNSKTGPYITVKGNTKLSTPKMTVKAYNKKVTISWKKNTKAEGYQIYWCKGDEWTIPHNDYYSMPKDCYNDYVQLKKITNNSTTSYTKSNLSGSKNYHFKMRAYKTINGKVVYSSWTGIQCKINTVSRLNAATKKSHSTYKIYNVQGKKTKTSTHTLTAEEKKILKNFASKHFKKDWSAAKKIEYTADWIRKNLKYGRIPTGSHSKNIFVYKEGQCSDYNGALVEMMVYLGYDANLVMGNRNGGGQHFWGEIKIDGVTYLLEVGEKVYDSPQWNYKWQFMCLKYSEADGGYKKNGKLY